RLRPVGQNPALAMLHQPEAQARELLPSLALRAGVVCLVALGMACGRLAGPDACGIQGPVWLSTAATTRSAQAASAGSPCQLHSMTRSPVRTSKTLAGTGAPAPN